MRFETAAEDGGSHWIAISDLMAGLMMIFLFISVVYMLNVSEDKQRMEESARSYVNLKYELYRDLLREFEDDLDSWNAAIDSEALSVRFQEPDVFFDENRADLQPRFREILDEFFPRYLRILAGDKYRNEIEEIRIEGHTSSGAPGETRLKKYMYNMKLSQERTRSVIAYVLGISEQSPASQWLLGHLTANGLSSSRPRLVNGREDRHRSRRVEFRVRTRSDDRIRRILGEGR